MTTGGDIEPAVTEALATLVVTAAGLYLGCGLAFAGPFVLRGVHQLDAVARDGTWGFRAAIAPGVALLWPLLAIRWARGSVHPPRELNAHRRLAARSGR
ncbi:MAG: hypothetical protein R2745_25500 [Vicinamibacterales bacterium]